MIAPLDVFYSSCGKQTCKMFPYWSFVHQKCLCNVRNVSWLYCYVRWVLCRFGWSLVPEWLSESIKKWTRQHLNNLIQLQCIYVCFLFESCSIINVTQVTDILREGSLVLYEESLNKWSWAMEYWNQNLTLWCDEGKQEKSFHYYPTHINVISHFVTTII